MSLYYDASAILANTEKRGGSLKSRVFGQNNLKNPPAKVYALLVESLKWSPVLKTVIERSDLLRCERKLSPVIAVLIVHDLLLSKRGIAAPKNHSLRASVERHKARLAAEFTRFRIRQGFGSLDLWKTHVKENSVAVALSKSEGSPAYGHPRWIRINKCRTEPDHLAFGLLRDYQRVDELEPVLKASKNDQIYYTDHNIPHLLALPSGTDLSLTEAYSKGYVVIQDKASCFPAYLLDPQSFSGDVIDACAAPGNKTTHVAAQLQSLENGFPPTRKVFAIERDSLRTGTLKKLVLRAGADHITTVVGNTDFLSINPEDPRFQNVGGLLLDPSCSGSGIVGRDDEPEMQLPQNAGVQGKGAGRKKTGTRHALQPVHVALKSEDDRSEDDEKALADRLKALSHFQLQIIQHAMTFPSATRISYSTCSIHAEENESVVIHALTSAIASERGWRILRRHEQVSGLQIWPHRGNVAACRAAAETLGVEVTIRDTAQEVADACIRCHKGTRDGTMGFFVAGFVRDRVQLSHDSNSSIHDSGEEWTGFDE